MANQGSFVTVLSFIVAALIPGPATGWCYLGGFALGRGKRMYLLKTESLFTCSEACEATSHCTHWSFESLTGSCVLRRNDSANNMLIRQQENATSAAKDCSMTLARASCQACIAYLNSHPKPQ